MTDLERRVAELTERIRALEAENERLSAKLFPVRGGAPVRVPEAVRPLFEAAARTVGSYFDSFCANPSQGTIEIEDERYVLVRANSLSYGFLRAIQTLYADRGDAEALRIGKTLLFDMAHVIGARDARVFSDRTGTTEALAKLSAGPIHFAYTGWAFVDILPESRPTPDDDFYLLYHHPFSFESHTWLQAGRRADVPVCVMNAGYSSGWCEESFGMSLSAAEIACKAKGDENCTFVMAPPHRLPEYVEQALADVPAEVRRRTIHEIPTLFERKKVEEQLHEAVRRAEDANEAKTRFLANMSHEIRTPLTGILGLATLLLREDLDPVLRGYVETIDQSGKALLGILNDILDISKVSAGMMTVSPEPCDVRAVLDDVSRVLSARAAEKALPLSVDVEPAVPAHVHTDPVRLRQVVLNLAANAVQFTDRGRVTIRARWLAPSTLRLEVEDTGIGIEPAEIDHIFDDFTQVDTSPSRRHAGTGLGLSITRRLVTLMGGQVGVQSRAGEGSTFWVELPAEPVAPRPPGPPLAPAAPIRRGANVLLVEDDRIARFVVERLLQDLGCRVETVVNGQQAVHAVATKRYDVVFMDCHLPVLDGFEATREIRRREGSGPRLPVVAMTASVMREDSERCREAGMDDFVGKPIDPEHLERVLARWVPAT